MARRYFADISAPAVIKAAEAHGKAIDSLLNYETVKYFGNENYVSARYDSELSEAERLTVQSLIFRSILGVAQMTVLGIGAGAIVVLGGMDVASGAMTVGAFVLINTYLLQLVRPLERLGNLYRSIKQALIDLEQMVRIFEEEPEVTDADGAEALPEGPGAIRFENVSFAYDPRRPILKNVSFELDAGRKLALVGPSGGGKTTLGRLLFRFYDPIEGRVEIDGHDIRACTQDTVRAAVGVVPQDTVLFNEAIGENIQFGRPGATGDEIEDAAKLAQIDGFIESLPDRFDTVVGERGLKLSGGEKQRVAIARSRIETSSNFPVRRSHVGTRQPYRAGNPEESYRGISRLDHGRYRPPVVDDRRRGSDLVCRGGQDYRTRLAPAAACDEGPLRRPLGKTAARRR